MQESLMLKAYDGSQTNDGCSLTFQAATPSVTVIVLRKEGH
jgi:hypothetical protein